MKRHLQIASAVSLALGMVAFKPVASSAENALRADDTETGQTCKYYKYYEKTSKEIICYDTSASNCAIC